MKTFMISRPDIEQPNHPSRLSLHGRNICTRRFFLGVDGGGSKTHAVVSTEDGGAIGTAGASNPMRVGFPSALTAIREAIDESLDAAHAKFDEIAAATIGLAGVRRAEIRTRMQAELQAFGFTSLHVMTDSEIALYGATDGAAGIVVIAGTGSICCGINARRHRACTGGWGPMVGDEGSGIWIAQRSLRAIAQASDERSAETSLVTAAYDYFNVNNLDELATEIYAPKMTNTRIAGFARRVIEAARAGDEVAREIVTDAGHEIGLLVTTTIKRLNMSQDSFRVAYVGGVFAAGELLMQPLREAVKRAAPCATIAPPMYPPAIAAARLSIADCGLRIADWRAAKVAS
ncbi:MAG: N-acetylglucosamine kinase [Pyrinomonadaceae bacterium]